ncbi:MAG: efflux RND transporter periplasmic adaptor subunit [Isosphaeraceae bacterium]
MSQELKAEQGNGVARPVFPATEESREQPKPSRPPEKGSRSKRWVVLLTIGVLAAAAFFWKGLPMVREMLTHVSTDDAFVAGDATQVSARIADQVEQVLVNDNDFVSKGTVLVRLDEKPFAIAVEQKRSALRQAKVNVQQLVAALETARAQLEQARHEVRAALAGLHEAWRGIEGRQDQVRYRVASLRAEIAGLRSTQASLTLAQREYDRVNHLVAQQTATREELDQKWAALASAQEQVKASEQKVQQARALLALAPDYEHPDKVPPDLERTDADVRRALASGQQILAQLGLPFQLLDMSPSGIEKSLNELVNQKSEAWMEDVPAVRTARAHYEQARAALGGDEFDPNRLYDHPTIRQAQKDLDDAELKLSYTTIEAPVTGYVNRRSVNPGDHVQAGQALLIVQPLDGVYVVANFKETQLADLTIGQPVDLYVDAYANHVFHGRVSGFAPATGAASSLLPAENATGNFVKVVQRLAVRIDLTEPNPPQTPLFVGLSVIPEVSLEAQPSGPDAGRRLRSGGTTVTTALAHRGG